MRRRDADGDRAATVVEVDAVHQLFDDVANQQRTHGDAGAVGEPVNLGQVLGEDPPGRRDVRIELRVEFRRDGLKEFGLGVPHVARAASNRAPERASDGEAELVALTGHIDDFDWLHESAGCDVPDDIVSAS